MNDNNEIDNNEIEVKVKHLIEYLQSLDPETRVALDRDGWLEYELHPKNELDLIKQRGIFYEFKHEGTTTLFINN